MLSLLVQQKPLSQIILKNSDKTIFVRTFDLESGQDFIKKFMQLNGDSNTTVIPVIISSYGGGVNSLISMLEIMSTASKPVSTIAIGAAMSCGSVLLASGTPGYRFAGQLTELMIHQVSGAAIGKIEDIQNDSKQTTKVNNMLLAILAKNSKKPVKFFKDKIKKMGNVDWYITSRQAKKLGLIDYAGIPVLLERVE